MSSNKSSEEVKRNDFRILESVQIFVDSNIRTIKNCLYVTGGVGLIIVARSIYLTKVFTRVEDIPAQFIHKKVKLRGMVKEITDEGVLSIEHIPIMRLRIPFTKRKVNECLPVHLACIDLSPEGSLWLTNNVLNKVVWFHLLHRTSSYNGMGSHLYSKIEIPQRFRRNIRVNEELVKMGLSKISSLASLEESGKMPTNKNLLLYLDRLVKLEHTADKKGVGMWNQPKETSVIKKGLLGVKNIVTSPLKIVRWIYMKWKGKN